jgi:hypothetical protein
MKKFKIIYNINNTNPTIIDSRMGIIFAIVDEEDLKKRKYSYQLKIKSGLTYYPGEEFDCYSIEETIIGFGNNGTSTRIIKDLDKEDIKLFLELISKHPLGVLEKYSDLILEEIIC